MKVLIVGLLMGMVFGFLLQKGRVVRYDKQIGALRFLDMTIVKFMFSSIVVAMVGLYLLKDFGMVRLMFPPVVLGKNIIGGLLFGIGWGILGYCPGTQLGALGEGRVDAFWGLLGMVVGAGLFAEASAGLARGFLLQGRLGQLTIHQAIGIHHWFVIVPIVVAVLLLFRWFEKIAL